ncbi:MAG TPA: 30S ribosomal protein S16 [Longimicrobiales bacterium]|nr:30S ribosomal protein S16 [Longimicrobiales bacterium]
MSVRIRLRRVGRKKQPYYRVVVMNSTASRDSAYIEEVGFYNPRTQPASLRMDLEKVDAWLGQGAELTDSAASLIRKARNGGDASVRLVQPGEEAAKTARVPERRPTPRQAVAEPEPQPSSSDGAPEPSAETIAQAEPQGEGKAEPEVVVDSGVEATPATAEAEVEEPAAEAEVEEPAAEVEVEEPVAEKKGGRKKARGKKAAKDQKPADTAEE